MKTKILLLLCIFLFSQNIKAQNDPLKGITDVVGSQIGMGSLMGQLVKGIKPSSFIGGKSGKSDLISQVSSIGSSDYLKYASVLGTLAGSLKGSSFLPEWADKKDGVLDQLKNAGSIADVATGTSSMLGMLDPSALTGSFKKNQGTYKDALNLLSKSK